VRGRLDVAGKDVRDAVAAAQRRVQRVDRRAGNAERGVHALAFKHEDGSFSGGHSGHGSLRLGGSDRYPAL